MELKKEEVLATLKSNSIITVNGQMFFGSIEEQENGNIKIADAVQCASMDVKQITNDFIKAMITSKLETITLGGIVGTVTKQLTDNELEDVEIACTVALRAARNAVPELMASKI